MSTTGLFALSADPIHFGHIDLIEHIASKIDKLYVFIGNNDDKSGKYLFPLATRIEMAAEAVKNIPNVEVIPAQDNNLLVDVYVRYGCDYLYRGLRNQEDADYEKKQMEYHKLIFPISVKYIYGAQKYRHISSGMVKAFAHHHLDVSSFVSSFVKRNLEEANGLYKVAITGRMATGKSYVSKILTEILQKKINTVSINMDDLIRKVYSSPEEGCRLACERNIQICKDAGEDILVDGKIDVKKLASFLFSDRCPKEVKTAIEQSVKPMVDIFYRDALCEIKTKPSIVILEWAQLAEMNMGGWTNHNVVIVDSPDRERLAERRQVLPSTLKDRSKFQLSADEKEKVLQDAAHGKANIIRFTNRLDSNEEDYLNLADKIHSILFR